MNWDDFRVAFQEAENTMRQCDNIANDMAKIIVGRLRKSNVRGSVLASLKRELKKFNIHTQEWMD